MAHIVETPSEIKALTLNCWGLKYISALRRERLHEIGRRLALLAAPFDPESPSSPPAPPLSIVALQECWCYEDFATIHQHTRAALPYAKFFHSGVWGAGLAVLSRWPITETSMRSYALNGRPTAFWRGDWFVGKGLASATVRVSEHLVVEVLVTHTHAPYERDRPDDSYLAHQLAQSWEAGKRMRAAAERGRLVLGMGDFNMMPESLPYKVLFLAAAGAEATVSADGTDREGDRPTVIRDSWRELHPDASWGSVEQPAEQARQHQQQERRQQQQQAAVVSLPSSPFIPSAQFNLTENGAASDNVFNTWRWPKDKRKRLHERYRQLRRAQSAEGRREVAIPDEFIIHPDTPDPHGKRLDYIFYAPPNPAASSPSLSSSRSMDWTAKTARVAMVEPHPSLGCSVSDHFAVEVTLARRDSQEGEGTAPTRDSVYSSKGTASCAPSIYDAVLAETEKYMLREQRQRHWRSTHFFASVAVAIGCYVAVWFSPRPFVAFLLMLFSSLGLAAGVVDGLLALLFFGSEIRSLKEFHWELRNARAFADPSTGLSSLTEGRESKMTAS